MADCFRDKKENTISFTTDKERIWIRQGAQALTLSFDSTPVFIQFFKKWYKKEIFHKKWNKYHRSEWVCEHTGRVYSNPTEREVDRLALWLCGSCGNFYGEDDKVTYMWHG